MIRPLRTLPPSFKLRASLMVGLACLCVGTAGAQALTPPPGMVTGAWGQSQSQSQQVPAAAKGKVDLSGQDPVARFLQERGIVAQAESNSLLNQVRDTAGELVLSAMNFLGVPYRYGGTSQANGFDCSGFTRHIFEMSVGLILPRRADEQAKLSSLLPIKKD